MLKYTFFCNITYIRLDFEPFPQKKSFFCISLLLLYIVSSAQQQLQFAAINKHLPATNSTTHLSYNGNDSTLIKIPLDSNMIVDFSGAWGKATVSTFHYFDSKADPRNGNREPDVTTGNTVMAAPDYYSYRRQRLIGGNFQQQYRLKEIWVCTSAASPFTDTVDLVLGDSAKSASFIYQYTNATKPTVRIITKGGAAQWIKVWEGDTTVQYFLTNIRWRSFYYQEGGYWVAPETNITGIVFYGQPTGSGEKIFNYADDAVIAAADKYRPSLRDLNGSNFYNIFPPADCDSFTIMRKGIQQVFRFSNDTLVLQPQQDLSSGDYYDSLLMTRMPNRRMYYQIQGPTSNVYRQTNNFSWRPVNDTSLDRRDPLSYTTFGKNMYNLAYAYGRNRSAPDVYAKLKNGHKKAANQYWGVEPGNEYNGVYFPDYWLDPIAAGCMMLMAIDGWKNRWGKGFGVKNADPDFKIYLPATAGLDVQYQRAVLKFLQYAYGTTHPPVDYIAFHSYPGSFKKSTGAFPDEVVGNYITFPSDKGYYQDEIKALHAMYGEWQGFIPCTINEYGADKSFLRTKTPHGQYDTSLYGIVQYDDYSPAQSLGIFLVSAKLMGAATSQAERVQYAFKDDVAPDTSNKYGGYSGSGYLWYYYNKSYGIDSVKYWDNFYYDQGITRTLFDYGDGTVIDSVSGGLFVIKYRHRHQKNKVVYAVWKDSSKTGKGIPVRLPVGQVQNVQLMRGSFNSLTPRFSKVTVTNGVIQTKATVLHQFFFVTEAAASNKKKKG